MTAAIREAHAAHRAAFVEDVSFAAVIHWPHADVSSSFSRASSCFSYASSSISHAGNDDFSATRDVIRGQCSCSGFAGNCVGTYCPDYGTDSLPWTLTNPVPNHLLCYSDQATASSDLTSAIYIANPAPGEYYIMVTFADALQHVSAVC